MLLPHCSCKKGLTMSGPVGGDYPGTPVVVLWLTCSRFWQIDEFSHEDVELLSLGAGIG